ncbi:MAG TPA: hypothetical protein VMW88_00285 [Thermoplasmata archaeon]|nr:hypothetical protein [Thermoplasmata archaeon]
MPFSSRVLEDSIRLTKIRRIKLALYVVQATMLIVLAFVMIFIFGNAQLTPVLYLPLDSFAAVMVLLILVVSVESFFFRIMEIRFARSSSAKHLMAKNSIRSAVMIVIVAAVATVMLMTPPILSAIQDATSKTSALTVSDPVEFWSRDPLALQRMVEVQATAVHIVEIYLVEGASFDAYKNDISQLYILRLNRDTHLIDGSVTIDIPKADHQRYVLVLNDQDSPGSAATVTIVRDASDTFTGVISLLALAMVVANIAWIAYLMPIERKYSHGSIYK